jgi:cobalt-zinc-cadmium efflux system outer membrane protein
MIPRALRALLFGSLVIATGSLLLPAEGSAFEASPGGPGPARPVLPEDATLDDYLDFAVRESPRLQAAQDRWQASLERVRSVRALPDPELSYSYLVHGMEGGDFADRQKIGLMQMFPWFGKRGLMGDMAARSAEAERQRYEAARLEILFQVKGAYYEYYYLARAISVAEENVRLLEQMAAVARTRYGAADAGYEDVIRAEVELSRMEDELKTQLELRGALSARLSAALGRPPDPLLPLPGDIPEASVSVSDEEVMALARQRNPELLAMESEALGERTGVRLARKNFYPDFSLGVETGAMAGGMPSGMAEDRREPVMAMFSITLPLWRGKYGAEKREAEARYSAMSGAKLDMENQLLADLRLALYRFHDAERKMRLYGEDLVPKTRQGLEVARRAYEAGAADFPGLIDGQRNLLEFELAYERARVDRAMSLAEVEMLAGGDMTGGMK